MRAPPSGLRSPFSEVSFYFHVSVIDMKIHVVNQKKKKVKYLDSKEK